MISGPIKRKRRNLSATFKPLRYDLKIDQEASVVVISGQKIGRPSKRITLHQKGLKVLRAKIIHSGKRGERSIEVTRINHHRGFEEVRLHADQLLAPGIYKIEILYKPQLLKYDKPSRALLPMIDEPGVEAVYNISHAQD